MVPLGHDEDQRDGESRGEDPAEHNGDLDVDQAEADANGEADEPRRLRDLRLTQEKSADRLVSHFAGDPRLSGAVRERLAHTPQDLEAGDRGERRDEALPCPCDADDEQARDHREAAAERIREHPGRDLTYEVGRLERGSDEYELQRIEMRDGDVVERVGGRDQREGEAAPCGHQEVDASCGQTDTICEQRMISSCQSGMRRRSAPRSSAQGVSARSGRGAGAPSVAVMSMRLLQVLPGVYSAT